MKVMVANRGEIAARIFRTLKVLNVPSLAIFAPPDEKAPHVWLADEAIALEQPSTHLDGPTLVALAQKHGVTHIHPGYGFLSQSPAFVRACCAAGLTFVGPSAQSMALLGDKSASRALAQSLKIPTIPGANQVDDVSQLEALGRSLGYPLLLKAAGGGGGRGMRQVHNADEAATAFSQARREAQSSSGDDRLLAERLITEARHIEIQVVADGRQARVAGDRECSLQRRYQKVIEEAPAATLTPAVRQAMSQAAIALAQAAAYQGVCTVEFLLDGHNSFYFLEVNPRLQVEHPVTEMCSQLDLVSVQMALANGASVADFDWSQPRGHAIEARLMAEDPSRDFLPQTGEILFHSWPLGPGIRVDSGIETGMRVSADYDALIAKIIAWGENRDIARRRLVAALEETVVLGVNHNLAFLRDTLMGQSMVRGQTFTDTLTRMVWSPAPRADYVDALAQTHAVEMGMSHPFASVKTDNNPWTQQDSFGAFDGRTGAL